MLNDCFLDLQRAAVALHQNPQGKTHLVFLDHAQRIADERSSGAIAELREDASSTLLTREAIRLADRILTLGLMLKES